jgi:hypothetical protein
MLRADPGVRGLYPDSDIDLHPATSDMNIGSGDVIDAGFAVSLDAPIDTQTTAASGPPPQTTPGDGTPAKDDAGG